MRSAASRPSTAAATPTPGSRRPAASRDDQSAVATKRRSEVGSRPSASRGCIASSKRPCQNRTRIRPSRLATMRPWSSHPRAAASAPLSKVSLSDNAACSILIVPVRIAMSTSVLSSPPPLCANRRASSSAAEASPNCPRFRNAPASAVIPSAAERQSCRRARPHARPRTVRTAAARRPDCSCSTAPVNRRRWPATSPSTGHAGAPGDLVASTAVEASTAYVDRRSAATETRREQGSMVCNRLANRPGRPLALAAQRAMSRTMEGGRGGWTDGAHQHLGRERIEAQVVDVSHFLITDQEQ